MYLKEFEIRWNDIDANRHLANSAYINFMSHTRLSYMLENGFGQANMAANNIGPVVFYEHMFYFKEVFPGKPITVSLALKGISKDGMYFSFEHNFFDHAGKRARCLNKKGPCQEHSKDEHRIGSFLFSKNAQIRFLNSY